MIGWSCKSTSQPARWPCILPVFEPAPCTCLSTLPTLPRKSPIFSAMQRRPCLSAVPESAGQLDGVARQAGVPVMRTLGASLDGSLGNLTHKLAPHEALTERVPDDVVAMLYTSGTTGQSKGAMLTLENLASNAVTLHEYWGFKPGDVLLHALPIFHVHGPVRRAALRDAECIQGDIPAEVRYRRGQKGTD